MNIFFDTNIVLELLADRAQADQVAAIIELCAKNKWNKFLSVGSVYTIAFMTERILHQQGLTKPNLTEKQREIFHDLLDSFEIVSLNSTNIADGADDPSFSDLEDSFQYQSALQADCEILITINIKDFKNADQENIKIMEPNDFMNKYNKN